MARKVGPEGVVLAFEPHPLVFAMLEQNKAMNSLEAKSLRLFKVALGATKGSGELFAPEGFETNTGTARLAKAEEAGAGKMTVQIETLDDVAAQYKTIHLCKVDVEGGELEVFQGAERLINQGGIRDIVYEDVGRRNKQLQAFLIQRGYNLFSLHTDFLKPRLENWNAEEPFKVGIEGENFLATLDPERARKRFAALGWKALRKI